MAQVTNAQATAWFALVETATGRLHSVGSVLASPMPPQYTVLKLPSQLDQDQAIAWNQLTARWEVIATGLPVAGITVVVP